MILPYIGNQTAKALTNPSEAFEFALQNNFNAFEWFFEKENESFDENAKFLKKEAYKKDIRISAHGHWWANPATPEGFKILANDLTRAYRLGAVLFNIHNFSETPLEEYREAIFSLAKLACEFGINLSIENTKLDSPQMMNKLFEKSLPQNVGMCLDMGHANICKETQNDYISFVKLLSKKIPITHLHFHENWGNGDEHLTLFTGPSKINKQGILDLVKRLKERNYEGSLILEQWPTPPTLLINARDELLKIWGS